MRIPDEVQNPLGIIYVARHKWLWLRGRVSVRFEWRSGRNQLGRFGGGWQWRVGVTASRRFRDIYICLFVASVMVAFMRGADAELQCAEHTKLADKVRAQRLAERQKQLAHRMRTDYQRHLARQSRDDTTAGDDVADE